MTLPSRALAAAVSSRAGGDGVTLLPPHTCPSQQKSISRQCVHHLPDLYTRTHKSYSASPPL